MNLPDTLNSKCMLKTSFHSNMEILSFTTLLLLYSYYAVKRSCSKFIIP